MLLVLKARIIFIPHPREIRTPILPIRTGRFIQLSYECLADGDTYLGAAIRRAETSLIIVSVNG
jgi:hypothetical protein